MILIPKEKNLFVIFCLWKFAKIINLVIITITNKSLNDQNRIVLITLPFYQLDIYMTDPIQNWDPQQQGQQWYTDDILGWEDIFAAIPKAAQEKQEIPYGELIEKKYQFTPIPEESPTISESMETIPATQEPKITPAPSVSIQNEEIKKPVIQPVPSVSVVQNSGAKEDSIVQEKIVAPVAPIVESSAPTLQPQTPKVEKKPVETQISTPTSATTQEPKIVPEPTVAIPKEEIKKPVIAPPISSNPIVSPVQKQTFHEEEKNIQSVPEEDISIIEDIIPSKELPIENIRETKLKTDVQKKFGELFSTTKKIYQRKDKLWITDDTFDILWADNDKIFISYRFLLDETDEPILFITKIEQDKETEEETVNELRFTLNEETSSLEVMINDTLLFDEVEDFTEDQKKKLQVVDKINKFTFLASEELRKIEKEIKEKEEAEQERKKLQEIFRNF